MDNNKLFNSQQEIAGEVGVGDIRRTLGFLFNPGEVFEICVISPKCSKSKYWTGFAGGKTPVIAGWFNDADKVLDLLSEINKYSPCAVYSTLNPVIPSLLARAENRLQAGVSRTQDKDIAEVKHLLIDADPSRPAGISSTDQEKEAALEVIRSIYGDLQKQRWSQPLFGDSGNGMHLIYPLGKDCKEIVPEVLKALDHRYSNDLVAIDTTVGNPARLVKLYGTWVRKGDSTADRPHRLAKILHLPEEVVQ